MKVETKYSIGDVFWKTDCAKEYLGTQGTKYKIEIIGPFKIKSIVIETFGVFYTFDKKGGSMSEDGLEVAINSGEVFSSIYDAHSWIEKDCDNVIKEIDDRQKEE